jgi:hypothetical protein
MGTGRSRECASLKTRVFFCDQRCVLSAPPQTSPLASTCYCLSAGAFSAAPRYEDSACQTPMRRQTLKIHPAIQHLRRLLLGSVAGGHSSWVGRWWRSRFWPCCFSLLGCISISLGGLTDTQPFRRFRRWV